MDIVQAKFNKDNARRKMQTAALALRSAKPHEREEKEAYLKSKRAEYNKACQVHEKAIRSGYESA